ncbi:zinc-dependent dehydrogenase [Paracidobacterium acidisoli]|uniref:Zn-dependent alcohol dehydrogenase n=1 Tax=Paracidobacterium acidisoli TaxID=2303751 RepID=A0A372ITX3_9BACT|nr:zinc-dependent dehydrogenase [Paracidobacterium acidisoli]MBT9329794.1 zinc-dependent dehydrogenase [Paracidobacterium acidisoli]
MATTLSSAPEAPAIVIPDTMRAAVYRGVNDVRVETVPVPRVSAGEVLIRVHCCGICGTDLKKIHTGSHSAPRIFGHEIAGTIAAVGDGVEGFAVGDRVMVFHHSPCGSCYYCSKKTYAQCELYKKVGCTAGFEPSGGGFAEYVLAMDWIVRRALVKIPDGVPFEQAAFVEPVNTCLKAVKNLNLQPDETVLVIGQGPIGVLLASLAARAGAKVLTSDLYPERHAIASVYGLSHPIDAGKENVVVAAHAASEGRGADAVLLAVGGSALIRTAMDAARPGGRVVLFAQTQHGEAVIDPAVVCVDEKALLGSYSSSADIQDEGAQLVFDGYRNSFDLTRLISHRFSLEEAVEAIHLASNPGPASMKIFILPQ